LSAPVGFLQRLGLLQPTSTFFDYGCGKGDDIQNLRECGIIANGWDPYYRPDGALQTADFVNLGFVINVIEDIAEREFALSRAYSLASVALVVATMLVSDQRAPGRPYRDGYVTGRGTFQKYYLHHELESYIADVLNNSPVPLGPGVFIVFKNKEAEAQFLSSRIRGQSRVRLRNQSTLDTRPRPKAQIHLTEVQVSLLESFWSQMLEHGRAPLPGEFAQMSELNLEFGSIRRATRLIAQRYDLALVSEASTQRKNELLVLLAVHLLRRSKHPLKLNESLREDLNTFFGGLRSAQAEAQNLIASLGNKENLETAIRWALEHGQGTQVGDKGFLFHRSWLSRFPATLQVTIWAASLLADGLEACDLIRVHENRNKISFYKHQNFDDPLPQLQHRCCVHVSQARARDYYHNQKALLLASKSRFLCEEWAEYPSQLEFDRKLDKIMGETDVLHVPAETVGQGLREALRTISKSQIVPSDRIPTLDEKCGHYLTYRDLIECGETQAKIGVPNLPRSPSSYLALRELAENIIDPVIEYFGAIELTYGFCSNELRHHIKARIAPKLDQHCAHEQNSKGELICNRKGAAIDFLVSDENMLEVVKWISQSLNFDRMYFYGTDRPIHVSYSDKPAGENSSINTTSSRRLLPRILEFRKME
jgi:DNA phosphorothioation-associated putative methyltransferase